MAVLDTTVTLNVDITGTGWLVEQKNLERPYWLTAYLGQLTFSADVNDALLFARPQDADAVIAELYNSLDYVSTEHQWRVEP